MTVGKMKRERAKALELLREEHLDEVASFKTKLEKAEALYLKGLPKMEYQLKPGEVDKHMSFWQRHPIWNKCINSVVEKTYTSTNITLVIYFKN